ncbi:MAG: PAS domain-containing protein, partial [Anaerolineales bacterium]
MDSVNQAVIATDLEGCVVFWNRFAEKLYGWTSDEALGRDVTRITPAPSSLSQAHEIMERLERGESWAGERLLQRRDGTTFTAYVTSSPIFDGEGGILGIVSVSHDITEEKRLREANRLLAEASVLLLGTDESEQSLSALAGLAVPDLADWCAVHLLQPDGSIEQVTPAAAGLTTSQTPPAWLQKQLADDD